MTSAGSQYEGAFAEESPSAFSPDAQEGTRELTRAECRAVVAQGARFAKHAGGIWLLIAGKLTSDNDVVGTDSRLRDVLRGVFGYPGVDGPEPHLGINLLLDSPGGSLDSAYAMALYLSAYTNHLRVFVPGQAKSASTLLALGGEELHLSAFGELGPLDTQVHDPRNPANRVSALDCFQSVDYVRRFGRNTMDDLVNGLILTTQRKIAADVLLDKASGFALGAVQPMLASVGALDFGGWGRSLMIGEHYTRKLLADKSAEPDMERIKTIANQLVYGYTHHLFPIDVHEARRIGLPDVGLAVKFMDGDTYKRADRVIQSCRGRSYIGFLSKREQRREKKSADVARRRTGGPRRPSDVPALSDRRPQRTDRAQGMAFPWY
ncbi:ATP-dependent Clp protease proteolytic subunit [Streptomyces sp. HPF1205]|uniref:ATP-dependent Clp protease proteolytic subunit n=1 Tax=Streptomyces sp. HPF1205 TaxID=2873262 RepID=UPI001CED3DEE|nr:ATP-dependent Clp protease proteolytic subunit [Streptomyces sp. HPF1205]